MHNFKKLRLEEDAILQAKQEKAVPEIVRQIQSVLPEFEGTVRERNQKKKKAAKKRPGRIRQFYSIQEWHDLRVMPFPVSSVHSVG